MLFRSSARTANEVRLAAVLTILGGLVVGGVFFFIGIGIGGGPGIGLAAGSALMIGMCIAKGATDFVRAAHILPLHRAALPPKDDPRWSDAPAAPQLAGKPCAECDRKIMLAAEGIACPACAQAVHQTCLTRHTLTHGPSGGPFRGV